MSKPKTLRFGIQSLDRLIGSVRDGERTRCGVDLSQPNKLSDSGELIQTDDQVSSSICLAGPDGTGKSVFSLHLASHYLADCLDTSIGPAKVEECPKVIYISTDLTYTIALRGWNRFDLRRPFERQEPLFEPKEDRQEHPGKPVGINLRQYFPSESSNSENSLIDYLEGLNKIPNEPNSINGEVCYVDLATRTAGDDWGFVHRLLSMLDEPEKDKPRHLVVLDAVEGFETLVGDLNAFGERSSRRSRIAQVMRLAAGKCHLLLVVEEKRDERFPEEFVTDVVVRLRNVETGRYLRRTVEIEKARGQLNVRGQHPYVIRDGGGSTTGDQINADDPKVNRDNGQANSNTGGQIKANDVETENGKEKQQAYVHVFLSPDNASRKIMALEHKPREATATDRYAAFGVPYLDNMLGGTGQKARRRKDNDGDTRGLACGSATALLGDSLTQKSQLGEAFLSRAFHAYAEDLSDEIWKQANSAAIGNLVRIIEKGIPDIVNEKTSAHKITKQVIDELYRQEKQIFARVDQKKGPDEPVTVMFTTRDVNNDELAEKFYRWLKDEDVIETKNDAIGKALNEAFEKALALQKTREDAGAPDELAAHVEGGITWFAEQFENFVKKQHGYEEGRKHFTDLLAKQILKRKLTSYIRDRTICRRFEIHDIPSAVLLHIFQRNIEKAQRIMLSLPDDASLPDAVERFRKSWRIRVVIDDLNSFRNIFPEIRDDPLMLPSLLFMLGREGVTSLIIDSQSSGSPELSITERFDSSVRELVQTRIYTWRLPFYGENRVAISLIPPISHEYRGLIRELRWETKGENTADRALTVDPHFELYMGLERGQPQLVPMEVRLYAETPSVEKYIATEEKLFREIFTPVGKGNEEPRVVTRIALDEYEALRDACHLQRDTRLDHTTILQVNEFWWLRRPRQRRAGAFRSQFNYLSAVTATLRQKEYCSESVVDTFLVFQPSPSKQSASTQETASGKEQPQEHRRLDFFDPRCGYNLRRIAERDEPCVDRVPYTWDFGFLLCNGKAWEEAFHLRVGAHKFQAKDFANLTSLITHLQKPEDSLSDYIKRKFPRVILEALGKCSTDLEQVSFQSFLEEFNKLLEDQNLYDDERFRHVQLSAEARDLLLERQRKSSQPKKSANNSELSHLNRTLLEDAYPREIFKKTIKGVWDRLRKATDESGPGTDGKESAVPKEPKLTGNQPVHVSWREFLAASKRVAEFQSYRTSTPATAFDFTMLIPESFSCLILEMWLSEVYETLMKYVNKNRANPATVKRLRKTTQLLKGIGRRRWYSDTRRMTLLDYLHDEKGQSLETIFEGRRNENVNCFSLELYKVWLLLTEAINFSELVDSSSHLNFEFKSRDASPQAVSARHWYKTASKFVDSLRPEQLEDNWVPVRLPGHFSVRADWFLAVAGGSRSSRLADHALDLLSSQRSNVTRLQEGIGLPTRKLFGRNNNAQLRTRLISVPEKGKPLTNVEYEELRRIGASNNSGDENAEEFYWLWRSGIAAYNRHSRIWHKWLNRSLLWWHSWRQRYGSNWTNGFEVYDLLTDAEFGEQSIDQKRLAELRDLESWKHFHEMRDILIAELEQAIIKYE
jgi:KaiC/GvpD/RAD55 family RecA-like ATPase